MLILYGLINEIKNDNVAKYDTAQNKQKRNIHDSRLLTCHVCEICRVILIENNVCLYKKKKVQYRRQKKDE